MRKANLWIYLCTFLITLPLCFSKANSADATTQKAKSGYKKELLKNIDSLGGNKDLYENLKKLHEDDNPLYVVQKRSTPRSHRSEIGFQSRYTQETYLQSVTLDLYYHYHLTPRWSFSAEAFQYINQLTEEGSQVLKDGFDKWKNGASINFIPDLTWIRQGSSVSVNYYPFYGKMSLFQRYIIYFDLFFSSGLSYYSLKDDYSATGVSFSSGIAFWVSKHLSLKMFVDLDFIKLPVELEQTGFEHKAYIGLSVGSFL